MEDNCPVTPLGRVWLSQKAIRVAVILIPGLAPREIKLPPLREEIEGPRKVKNLVKFLFDQH